ncbi:hypothetical protein VTN00DRAFT_3659 [Thermoascus crustaceus]|uniref:uncharacterized protein n=1 Tax=Thermoascus crustaceus TaxID=5088 RepID=UPI003744236C
MRQLDTTPGTIEPRSCPPPRPVTGFCHFRPPMVDIEVMFRRRVSALRDLENILAGFSRSLNSPDHIHSFVVKTIGCRNMSRASKFTLAATSLATVGIVYFVHWAQEADRAALHAGVERDEERQRIKRERQAEFEMQRRLEEEYRKIQTVSDNGNGGSVQGDKNTG